MFSYLSYQSLNGEAIRYEGIHQVLYFKMLLSRFRYFSF